jgi:hypothetical protein
LAGDNINIKAACQHQDLIGSTCPPFKAVHAGRAQVLKDFVESRHFFENRFESTNPLPFSLILLLALSTFAANSHLQAFRPLYYKILKDLKIPAHEIFDP